MLALRRVVKVMMMELPYTVSYSFDENLREVPHSPSDMEQAMRHLIDRYERADEMNTEKIELAGRAGVYARILGDFDTAHTYLMNAVLLSQQRGDEEAITRNQIRLAHLYQWQENYTLSNQLFSELLARCETNPALEKYVDVVLQHAGKNKFDQGLYEEALLLFSRAHDLRLQNGNPEMIASSEHALEVTRNRVSIAQ